MTYGKGRVVVAGWGKEKEGGLFTLWVQHLLDSPSYDGGFTRDDEFVTIG